MILVDCLFKTLHIDRVFVWVFVFKWVFIYEGVFVCEWRRSLFLSGSLSLRGSSFSSRSSYLRGSSFSKGSLVFVFGVFVFDTTIQKDSMLKDFSGRDK